MTVWYTARGAGLSALLLLTITICLGAYTSGRGKPGTRYVLQYVHRVCAGLGIGVVVAHIATILADSYAHVGVTGALVPFTSGYRATWVGLGSIAAYLLVLVSVMGAARGRMARTERGARMWRSVHVLGYGSWGLAMLHGWTSGSDTPAPWVRVIYLVCGLAGAGALAWRLLDRSRPRQLIRAVALIAPAPRPVLTEVAR